MSSRFFWKSSLIILRENIYMDTTFHALLFVIPIYGRCNPLSILLNKIETGCWDSDGDDEERHWVRVRKTRSNK